MEPKTDVHHSITHSDEGSDPPNAGEDSESRDDESHRRDCESLSDESLAKDEERWGASARKGRDGAAGAPANIHRKAASDGMPKPDNIDKENRLPLFTSPSDSFDTHDWRQKPRGSPASRWPQRSPFKESRGYKSPPQEEASFAFFNQSFDCLSETGTYLHEMHDATPQPRNHSIAPAPSDLRETTIDISLPALSHSRTDSTMTVDISPIRTNTPQAHRRPSLMAGSGQDNLLLPFHCLPSPQGNLPPPTPPKFYPDGWEPTSQPAANAPRTPPAVPQTVTPARPFGFQEKAHPYGQYVSNPIFVLRSCSQAFSGCTFLLGCVRNTEACPVNLGGTSSFRHYYSQCNLTCQQHNGEDLLVARRRVKSAVCAFGGNPNPPPHSTRSDRDAIFRFKPTNPGSRWGRQHHHPSSSRQVYDQRLHRRYYLSEGRVSWDVEEHPPVLLTGGDQPMSNSAAAVGRKKTLGRRSSDSPQSPAVREKKDSPTTHSAGTPSPKLNEPPKMRYRCKLCGQPKQNHNCPYRQSMQRSIGVMVYPALNAFTSKEPGDLAPALSEMNNFVSYDSESMVSAVGGEARMDTPGTEGKSSSVCSPPASVSNNHSEVTPSPSSAVTAKLSKTATSRKRNYSDMMMEEEESQEPTSPFVEGAPLRPEQYRAVTPSSKQDGRSYQYNVIPLTFRERKRLSDVLFLLSKEVPNFTEECAAILHDARERDLWDLAVADLLTQLVVALYCGEGDKCLEGLSQYLLSLGVAC